MAHDHDKTLPEQLHKVAVDHLRATMPADVRDGIRALIEADPKDWAVSDETPPEKRAELKERYGFYMPTPFHFSLGMAIRNVLREVITDDELPGVDYDGVEQHNWDDFYVSVVEEAVKD